MPTKTPVPTRSKWTWEGGSPFVSLLRRHQIELQKEWTNDRMIRLAKLGGFTMEELSVMVGTHPESLARVKRVGIPTVLNLQRLEDYVIHRKLKYPPNIRPEDALLVKLMNRESEQEGEKVLA